MWNSFDVGFFAGSGTDGGAAVHRCHRMAGTTVPLKGEDAQMRHNMRHERYENDCYS